MALKLYKFKNVKEAELFLQGALVGKDISGGVVGLVGLTLNFTTPLGSVTFATANRENDALLLKDIKAQVEAAIATLRVLSFEGRIVIIEASPTTGISVPSTNQVAKSLLGFDQNSAFVSKVYGVVPGTPPAWLSSSLGHDGMILITTNE